MKTAQLIKVTQSTLYFKNGELISEQLTPKQKMHISIFGETQQMKTEEVIERWNLKTKKEAEQRFWEFIQENNLDSANYYLVFDF